MRRIELNREHTIQSEPLSIRARMSMILDKVRTCTSIDFSDLFLPQEGRAGVVVTFIAILELLRQSVIDVVQSDAFAPIHLKAVK